MLFNSFQYMIFLPIVFLVYYRLPNKFRWVLLLAASYYFYMSWKAEFIILILLSTVIDYFCAHSIHKMNTKNIKNKFFTPKFFLIISLSCNLGLLFFFKYFNFFSESISNFLKMISIPISTPTLNIILPVGISFYTFQTLSYTIDIYRKKAKPEKHFGYFALYVSFFPQLVAGPIERPQNLLPQFKQEHKFNYDSATYGIKLMAWGFFKKLCIAEVLSVYVDKIYSDVGGYSGFALVLATVFFAFQIYCDFSGYSDIAIGTANLFGIDLMCNFKSPYFSTSIKKFWSRWHISLSTWFRDYVYIPLGGNRVGRIRHQINLFITFLLSGIWHGANWTFVIWGTLHGAFSVIENIGCKFFKKESKNSDVLTGRLIIVKIISVVIVFALVCFAWIFFRANSLSDAKYIILNMFSGITSPIDYLKQGFVMLNMTKEQLVFCAIPILMLITFDFFNLKIDLIKKQANTNFIIRWISYILFIIVIIVFAQKNNAGTFIYFQF